MRKYLVDIIWSASIQNIVLHLEDNVGEKLDYTNLLSCDSDCLSLDKSAFCSSACAIITT